MCTSCQMQYEQIRLTEGSKDAAEWAEKYSCDNQNNRNYCSECKVVWIRCDEDLCLSCKQKRN